MTDQMQPFFVANDLLDNVDALRARFDDDGYLFFKQQLPKEALTEVNRDFTATLQRLGVASPGATDSAPAIAEGAPFREGEPEYFATYDELYRCESFHRLAHHENLMRIMRLTLGATAFPHPLAVARLIFPNNDRVTTPPHQDFPNNQGSSRLTAAWIPLSDCPRSLGPLKILRGSHKQGVLPLQFHLGAGHRQAKLDPRLQSMEWHCSAFEQGDILLFGALTVHSATHNTDPQAMRLSVDYRYQTEGEPMTAMCLQPHFGRQSWESIYRGWKHSDAQYYWRDKQFSLVPWRRELHQLPAEEEAIGMKQALKYAIDNRGLKLKL